MRILHIKKFDEKISNFIFRLRNKKYVVINSLKQNKILRKEHNKWLKKFLSKKNKFFILKIKKNYIGYIRIEKMRKNFKVSWALLKKYKNKKIMSFALQKITDKLRLNYVALIKKNNYPSIKVATNAGFKLSKKSKTYFTFYK